MTNIEADIELRNATHQDSPQPGDLWDTNSLFEGRHLHSLTVMARLPNNNLVLRISQFQPGYRFIEVSDGLFRNLVSVDGEVEPGAGTKHVQKWYEEGAQFEALVIPEGTMRRYLTSTLFGTPLNWAVAKAIGTNVSLKMTYCGHKSGEPTFRIKCWTDDGKLFEPDRDWLLYGMLVKKYDPEERFSSGNGPRHAEIWCDKKDGTASCGAGQGKDRHDALCRAVVNLEFSVTMEVPGVL